VAGWFGSWRFRVVLLSVSLASVDPFGMSVKARKSLLGAKAGFVMDLAWAARVLASLEKGDE
jgi:hypothetical protein